jgi:hypothetical protein
VIRQICDALARRGLVEPARPPSYNAHFSGAAVMFDVLLDGARFLHVKASDLEPLHAEAAALTRARTVFGDTVPEPLLYEAHAPLEFIVTEGVHARPLAARDVLQATPRVVRELADHLAKAGGHREAGSQPHSATLLEATRQPALRELAQPLGRWLTDARRTRLDALPAVPQHGDFTPNNLAVRPDGRLVVFDWEDSGKTSLPGLDVCTLLLSLAGFDAGRFEELTAPRDGPHDRLLAALTSAVGLTPDDFRALVPAYLVTWLRLKTAYNRRMQLAVGALARERLRAEG